jgi:hypothetical protein
MKLHKQLSDEKLEIAFLTVSIFPHSEIVKTLQEESIILDTGNLEWWQVAQLLKVEMSLRGIIDNTDFQEKYLSTRKN